MTGALGILVHVEVESGVSADTGKPFCTIRATAEAGTVLVGQLAPAEVRGMALQFLEAAEAAEQDAHVFAELVEVVGLDEEQAARFIAHLRSRRDEP